MKLTNSDDSKYKKQKIIKYYLDNASSQVGLTSEVLRVTKDVVNVLYSYKKQGIPFSDIFNEICEINLPHFESVISDYRNWLDDVNDLSIASGTTELIEHIQEQYLILPKFDNDSEVRVNTSIEIMNRIDDVCKKYSITKLSRHLIISYIFSKFDFEGLNPGMKRIYLGKFYYIKEGLDRYENFFKIDNDDFLDVNLKIMNRLKSIGFMNDTSTKLLEYIINLLVTIEKRDKNKHFKDLVSSVKSYIGDYENVFISAGGNSELLNAIYMKIKELEL